MSETEEEPLTAKLPTVQLALGYLREHVGGNAEAAGPPPSVAIRPSVRIRLHATYLSDLERGMQTLTLDVVNRLATALKVSLAELFAPMGGGFRQRARQPRSDGSRRKPAAR